MFCFLQLAVSISCTHKRDILLASSATFLTLVPPWKNCSQSIVCHLVWQGQKLLKSWSHRLPSLYCLLGSGMPQAAVQYPQCSSECCSITHTLILNISPLVQTISIWGLKKKIIKMWSFNISVRLKLWQGIGNGKSTCKSSGRTHEVIKKCIKCINSTKIMLLMN